jgi:hypothetical protein
VLRVELFKVFISDAFEVFKYTFVIAIAKHWLYNWPDAFGGVCGFPVVFGAIKLAGPGVGVVFVFHLTIPFWV